MTEFSNIAERIKGKLTARFSPSYLEVIDESHKHIGHAGADPRGESHFKVKIGSPAFAGISRVERHRMVHEVLEQELKERVHALSLEISDR